MQDDGESGILWRHEEDNRTCAGGRRFGGMGGCRRVEGAELESGSLRARRREESHRREVSRTFAGDVRDVQRLLLVVPQPDRQDGLEGTFSETRGGRAPGARPVRRAQGRKDRRHNQIHRFPSYTLAADDLYVRARVESDAPTKFKRKRCLHPAHHTAWTQPYSG